MRFWKSRSFRHNFSLKNFSQEKLMIMQITILLQHDPNILDNLKLTTITYTVKIYFFCTSKNLNHII